MQKSKSIKTKFSILFTAAGLITLIAGITAAVFLSASSMAGAAIVSVLTVVSIIICIIGIVSAGKTAKPFEELAEKASELSKGNFKVSFRTNNSSSAGHISNCIADAGEGLANLMHDISQVSEKIKAGSINVKIDETAYSGDLKKTAEEINNTMSLLFKDTTDIITLIESYADGNFGVTCTNFKGEKASLNKALDKVNKTLYSISMDLTDVITSACDGDLTKRIDENKYKGGWMKLAEKSNEFLELITNPINEIFSVCEQISKSNLNVRVHGDYKGIFKNMKNSLNMSLSILVSCISEITEVLTKMANQDFNVSISDAYEGNFKELRDSVDMIISHFNTLLVNIEASANQIVSESKQISYTSSTLADNALMQSNAIHKLNSGISKLSEQSRENEKSTLDANELAILARESASIGNQQMNNMLAAMSGINDASNSISNIIKVIEDIAFQTNILALNAAVEAARAGEHGKGFAVVAEEVRNLAARSQQAAKETTELIESSIAKISDGSEIAHSTAASLTDIINKINSISSIIENTSKISSEQSIEIKNLNNNIDDIERATRTNTSTSSQAASASSVLVSQAELLTDSISKFTKKGSASKASIKPAPVPSSAPKSPAKKIEVSKPILPAASSEPVHEISYTPSSVRSHNSDFSAQDFGKY